MIILFVGITIIFIISGCGKNPFPIADVPRDIAQEIVDGAADLEGTPFESCDISVNSLRYWKGVRCVCADVVLEAFKNSGRNLRGDLLNASDGLIAQDFGIDNNRYLNISGYGNDPENTLTKAGYNFPRRVRNLYVYFSSNEVGENNTQAEKWYLGEVGLKKGDTIIFDTSDPDPYNHSGIIDIASDGEIFVWNAPGVGYSVMKQRLKNVKDRDNDGIDDNIVVGHGRHKDL